MQDLADRMAAYAAYHRNPINRALHAVGIPAIVWSLMVALAFVPLGSFAGLDVTAAHAAALILLGWYLILDFALGVAATAAFSVLLVGALEMAARGSREALTAAGIVFAGSWVLQLAGHGVWEKRRPALADNVLQVFVAPIFLVAETAFALGLRRELRDAVHERLGKRAPAATPVPA